MLSTSITGTATATTARENGTWRKNDVHASSATRKPAARKTARYSSLPAPANRVAYAPWAASEATQTTTRRR